MWGGDNSAPVINSLTAAPSTLAPGGQTQITCDASDPDGDGLTYQWWRSGGSFVGGTAAATVIWRAPAAAGDYQVRCTVSDGSASDVRTVTVRVRSGGGGTVTRRAVCVGVSDYIGSANDLSYCDKDARDFADALAASSAWDPSNIEVIVNRQATAANMWAALRRMAEASDADDQCVFFFSGHGGYQADQAPLDETDGADEYLCETNLEENITDDQLGVWVANLPTDNVVIVLCSCFSGGFVKGPGAVKSIGPLREVRRGDGFAADLERVIKARPKDVDDAEAGAVLTACDDDETCSEDGQHQNDLYNYYVVQGMRGPADANSDGDITAEEIFAYSEPLATQRSLQIGAPQHAQLWDADPASPLVLLSSSGGGGGGGGEFDPVGTWSVPGQVEMAWYPYSNVRLVFAGSTVQVYCYDSTYGEQLIFEGAYTRDGNRVRASDLPETNIGYGPNNTISFDLTYRSAPARLEGTMTEFARLTNGQTLEESAQITAYYGVQAVVSTVAGPAGRARELPARRKAR